MAERRPKELLMSAYAKTATGETLTYRPSNLEQYAGEPFCLRITPEDIDLERCFFVYLDERYEDYAIGRLFQEYFLSPKATQIEELESWMAPWLRVDPMLPKKYMLLRQVIAKVLSRSGQVQYYINHGPGPINTHDSVRDHLGTSVFSDGSFNDKILDLVLEFHADDLPLPELDQWASFDRTSTAGVTGPTKQVRRRRFLTRVVAALVALIAFPFLIFSCGNQNNRGGGGGGGFGGGML